MKRSCKSCVKVSSLRSQRSTLFVMNGFNLCELSQKNMLKKFNIDKLVRICEHFELDFAAVSRHRKEFFINQIQELLGSYSCNM